MFNIRSFLGLDQQEKRISEIEKRLDRIEDSMVRSSELELLEKEVEDLKSTSREKGSKKMEAREFIVRMKADGLEKSEIKKKILEREICSESHFYRIWNELQDQGFLVDGELVYTPKEILQDSG